MGVDPLALAVIPASTDRPSRDVAPNPHNASPVFLEKVPELFWVHARSEDLQRFDNARSWSIEIGVGIDALRRTTAGIALAWLVPEVAQELSAGLAPG